MVAGRDGRLILAGEGVLVILLSPPENPNRASASLKLLTAATTAPACNHVLSVLAHLRRPLANECRCVHIALIYKECQLHTLTAMKTEALSVRVSPAIKKAVEKAAKDDHRSSASLVEKIVSDWLREHGYLPK
jgi:hypothetical protein